MRWKVGEDLPDGLFSPGGEVRNMKNPLAFGDPDRMRSLNYTADLGGEDGGGVHANSGVNNKAASLMTDGGTFNGRTVTSSAPRARRRLRRWPKSTTRYRRTC